jgi:phosphatidylglycerol:prolipoprotein diacylglycerol transferase
MVWVLAQTLAALVAIGYVAARTRQRPLVARFTLALAAGVLGAYAWGFVCRLLERLAGREVDLIGVSAYGALAGVALGFAFLARRRGLTVVASLDLIAPALALLVAFGRLGCFLAGCDAGSVSASPWAVRFPAGSAAFRDHVAQGLILATDRWSLAVHPAQLYEAGLALALSYVGHRLGTRRAAPGSAFGATALGYALARSFVDTLRFPAPNAIYGLLTSLLVSVAVVTLLLRNSQRARAGEPAIH